MHLSKVPAIAFRAPPQGGPLRRRENVSLAAEKSLPRARPSPHECVSGHAPSRFPGCHRVSGWLNFCWVGRPTHSACLWFAETMITIRPLRAATVLLTLLVVTAT